MFDEVTPNSLVILDELYTGTKPIDGETESRGVIRQLHRSGATTYFSTHYHNLASEVESLPHAKNLMCASEQNNGHLEYTYNIVHGYTDKSEGRYLAKAKGMDEDGLARRLDTRAREGEITLRE